MVNCLYKSNPLQRSAARLMSPEEFEYHPLIYEASSYPRMDAYRRHSDANQMTLSPERIHAHQSSAAK